MPSNATAAPVEPATTTKVPLDSLRLDRRNPRLIGGAGHATDESIIARLYGAAELDELLQSVSANGYLDVEPLIVTRGSGGDDLVVLEGNRRLAALRLLREPDLADRIASSERIRIRVPLVDSSVRDTFDPVSAHHVASREDARAFIGFKHINGPAKWDAYAKARFVAAWYRAGRPDGVDLDRIARSIGDRHDTIKRMVSAICVLDQAIATERFAVADRFTKKFNFSHLYAALGWSPYREYLGLGSLWARHDPTPDPVPADKLDALRKVLVWIYGSKTDDAPPVVRSQNPDIKRLGEVLASAEGRHVLEATRSLDEAHASTESVDTRLTASLLRARDAMRAVAGSLRAYDGRDKSLLDLAENVKKTADSLDEAHASTESVDTRFAASLLRARDAMREAAGSLRAYDGRDESLLDVAEDVKETADSVHSSTAKKFREARAAR